MTDLDFLFEMAQARIIKKKVAEVKRGSIVRYQGEWGVLEKPWLDRWIGGPLRLRQTDVVEVLESAPRANLPP